MRAWFKFIVFGVVGLGLLGCAPETQSQSSAPQQPPPQQTQSGLPPEVPITPAQAQRLQAILGPLLQNMDDKIPANQVRVHVWNSPEINAANAGGGEFYVTTGLLQKANDNHLRAILAHEAAHADLGHVAKQQTLGAGLEIGAALLEQIWPGSGVVTPIAGQLIAASYSRGEEKEADAHGVQILRRAGHDGKALMAGALSWLQQSSGGGGGGFFSTHPPTGDRIEAVQALP
jgi:putative metalloprotease